jgi:hypothetical protein
MSAKRGSFQPWCIFIGIPPTATQRNKKRNCISKALGQRLEIADFA